ncbi:type IV pilin-like G/H family protein [Microcoleus sp. herbarium19]|uniref:type IV pilin-like G/H family protein n=1 Tax=unclassified Microcoleus TaxID=2642155 RepID=UPI002FD4F073
MSQQKSKSNSILLQVYSGLLKGCGCLLLAYIGLIGCGILFGGILFYSFGIKDKQVEIWVGYEGMAIKAKQSEGKQYVGSLMNRAQQAYFAENGTFSNSIEALGLGIKTETTNYKYSIRVTKTAAFNYGVSKKYDLKSYFGGVFLVPAKELDRNAMTTVSILCEPEKRLLVRFKPTDEPAEPIYQNGEVICGKGTTEVTK